MKSHPFNQAFTMGKKYQETVPDVWPPYHGKMWCLLDDTGGEHFMNRKEMHRYFVMPGSAPSKEHQQSPGSETSEKE